MRKVLVIFAGFLFSFSAMSDDCQIPSASVYSAPLAQAFIGYIQPSLPNVQFNPSLSQIVDVPPRVQGDVGTDGIILHTVDGTALEVGGTFEIFASDNTDNEGDITGCTLWVRDVFNSNPSVYIDGVTNVTTGHNVLPVALLPFGNGPSFSLGIVYPHSQ